MFRNAIAAAALAALAAPAQAEVSIAEHGFTTTNTATVDATPMEVWAELVEPSRYWNGDHSWSADAGNFSLDARAGGCFCESWIDRQGYENSAEHMRVVMVRPGQLLRLSGALGPLQSEGLAGALSWQLEAVDGGTQITQVMRVGGHMQFDSESFPPIVDAVLREQLQRLVALFVENED